ncbi:RDD family protein [Streptomyces iranensis]|uniref:RDD family protein n=1 Tax=Streptomyces iranensis TaxID=576784 RepID=UPI0039B75E13
MAWFVLLPLATGATPGKRLLLLKLVADDGGPLMVWRLTLRALLIGALVMPFLAGLFLAVLTLLNEPYPARLFATVRDSGTQGAAAILMALSPAQLLTVMVGFTLTAVCVRKTLRHPDRLAPHDRISGIRNATLPHRRAVRAAVGTATADRPAAPPADQSADQPAAPPAERPADRPADRPAPVAVGADRG